MKVHTNNTRVEVPDTNIPNVKACLSRNNEDTSSNPPTGREISDSMNHGISKLMNCKRFVQIGTFNARTLRNSNNVISVLS